MPSFGEELKRERELREISLREVAEATKVNIRFLEAMERNDFSSLPGGLFNKGFVRAYAQFVGIDPEAMVNAYLLEEQAQSRTTQDADNGVMRGSQARPERRTSGAPQAVRAKSTAPAAPATRKAPASRRWGWFGLGALLIGLLLALAALAVLVARSPAFGGSTAAPAQGDVRHG